MPAGTHGHHRGSIVGFSAPRHRKRYVTALRTFITSAGRKHAIQAPPRAGRSDRRRRGTPRRAAAGERLRSHIAVGVATAGEPRRFAKVVELRAKVGKVVVQRDVVLEPPDLASSTVLWNAISACAVLISNAAYQAPRSGPLNRLPSGCACVKDALTTRQYGTPYTSSCTSMPGNRSFSASRRSFVALSRSKMSRRCPSLSAIRKSTLLPTSPYCEGISRCVSRRRKMDVPCNPWVR